MAAHDARALVCRLFAGGTPVLRTTLSPREIACAVRARQAVSQRRWDQSFVLRPHCQQHPGAGLGRWSGRSDLPVPGLQGPVPVEATTARRWPLDEDWLRQKMRLALDIESRDGIDDLGRRRGGWRCPAVARPAGPQSGARCMRTVLLDRVRWRAATSG